jgi:hypothetical protein
MTLMTLMKSDERRLIVDKEVFVSPLPGLCNFLQGYPGLAAWAQ